MTRLCIYASRVLALGIALFTRSRFIRSQSAARHDNEGRRVRIVKLERHAAACIVRTCEVCVVRVWAVCLCARVCSTRVCRVRVIRVTLQCSLEAGDWSLRQSQT